MSKQQAQTVASIALNLSKSPVPCAVEILGGLNAARKAGFQAGWDAFAKHAAQMQSVVDRLYELPKQDNGKVSYEDYEKDYRARYNCKPGDDRG
jgi:hypothetical protein